jgi:hypothetical protein
MRSRNLTPTKLTREQPHTKKQSTKILFFLFYFFIIIGSISPESNYYQEVIFIFRKPNHGACQKTADSRERPVLSLYYSIIL